MRNIFKVLFPCILLATLTSSIMTAQNNDYMRMIEYATKAPSGHNTQPWKFKINENRIDIIPDYSKTLSIVDADNRELFISLGCATENLCISASNLGYETNIFITEEGVISVHINKSDQVQPDSLFSLIEKRQTNRNIYNNLTITNDILQECLPFISQENNIYIHYWEKGSSEFEAIKQLVVEGNIIQMENKEFVKELKSWMRINKKESNAKKDGLSYDAFGAPNLPGFIAKPAIGSFLNSKKQNKGDIKKIESSSHFILFTTKNNNIYDWIMLGRYMQRFLLKSTSYGISHAYTNQPCEIKELREKLKKELLINENNPQILLRIGYAKQAPYSKRKNIEDVIIQ